MSNEAIAVPEGYRKNSKGHLIPETMIRPVDLVADDLIRDLANRWKQQSVALSLFKRAAFGDVHALIAVINEQYAVKRGGEKGNVQFYSYDGRYKLLIAVNESVGFGPELQAAREKIYECVQGWKEGSQPELVAILNEIFSVDGKGGIIIGRILQVRRWKIETPDWQLAMQALDEAIRVVGSKQYIRMYERDEAGSYLPIPLDIAAL